MVGGVSLSEDTIPPHASAILDVRSVGRGVLISRMTTEQRDAIEDRAEGLIVYVTDLNKGFHYFDGAEWKMLRSSKAYYPQGAIVMYSGTIELNSELFDGDGKGKEETRMEGWQLCNGKNGSPDLQDRFIVGIAKDKTNDDYGTYKRMENDDNDPELPIHTYKMSQNTLPYHKHGVPKVFIDGYKYVHSHELKQDPHNHPIQAVTNKESYGFTHRDTKKMSKSTSKNVKSHTLGLKLEEKASDVSFTLPEGEILPAGTSAGSIEPIDNRPPYYVVAFLMRTDGEKEIHAEGNTPIKEE